MNSLYDIRTRIMELATQDELNEEESFELERLITQELNTKSINIIGFVRNAEANISAIDNEIERLTLLKNKNNNTLSRFKEYVKDNMSALQLEKIQTSIGTLRVQKNPISVEIVDEKQIPVEYKKEKTVICVDKTAIKNNFKETGEIIPGTRIIANKTSLRIV